MESAAAAELAAAAVYNKFVKKYNSEQSTKRPPTSKTCFLDVVLICNKFRQNKDIHGFSFSLIQVGVLVMRQS